MSPLFRELFTLNALPVAATFLIVIAAFSSGLAKIANLPAMRRKWNDQFQMPDALRIPAGTLELLAAILFVIPDTQTIGGILLTAYLGGAIALHLRIRAFTVSIYASVMVAIIWTTLAYR